MTRRLARRDILTLLLRLGILTRIDALRRSAASSKLSGQTTVAQPLNFGTMPCSWPWQAKAAYESLRRVLEVPLEAVIPEYLDGHLRLGIGPPTCPVEYLAGPATALAARRTRRSVLLVRPPAGLVRGDGLGGMAASESWRGLTRSLRRPGGAAMEGSRG